MSVKNTHEGVDTSFAPLTGAAADTITLATSWAQLQQALTSTTTCIAATVEAVAVGDITHPVLGQYLPLDVEVAVDLTRAFELRLEEMIHRVGVRGRELGVPRWQILSARALPLSTRLAVLRAHTGAPYTPPGPGQYLPSLDALAVQVLDHCFSAHKDATDV